MSPRSPTSHPSRRSVLAPALCSALALALGACGRDPGDRPGVPPRHVLLITASSLRADHLSCYLYPRPTSAWPATEEDRRESRALALDDLAAQGVMFANAFSPANRTVPALQALFTGSAGVVPAQDLQLGTEANTLAEVFQKAGFRTAAFVSGAALKDQRGLEQGFDHFTWRFGDTPVLALASDWLATRDGSDGRPLFLWIHLSGCDPPHDPRALPPRPGDVPGPFDFARYFEDPAYAGSADGSLATLEKVERGELVWSERDLEHVVDLYDGEVARVASGVRGLALFLRNDPRNRPGPGSRDGGSREDPRAASGEVSRDWLDTLVVFAGLHGIELGELGRGFQSQRSVSEAVLRIPLFFRHPGSLTGARILAEPVGLEDVAPTVCEWFHLDPPSPARSAPRAGRTLLPLMDSFVRRPFASRPAIAQLESDPPSGSLRTREWSLWWHGAGGADGEVPARAQLFDRERDPLERRDLSQRRPEVVRELLDEFDRAALAAGWRR